MRIAWCMGESTSLDTTLGALGLAAVAFLVPGCKARGPDMSALFPDVQAFAGLTDVRPGMSIHALRRARHPTVAPYLGYTEVRAGTMIQYRIDHPLESKEAGEFLPNKI